MKKIVVLGGGNGTAIALQALKPFGDAYELSAVVAMTDSGGSSGEMQKMFGVLPAGDMVRAILALSPYDYETLHAIFRKNRFSAGSAGTQYVGSLFLGLLEQFTKDPLVGIRGLHQAVEAKGKALPVTIVHADLCVEMEDGTPLRGEQYIDRPEGEKKRITRAWLDPVPQAHTEAVETIQQADIIVLGPGSLYTSIIPTLLPRGISEALKQSDAKFVFVSSNSIELNGEWCPRSLSETLEVIQQYLPRPLDLCISNAAQLNESQKSFFVQQQWGKIEIDIGNVKQVRVVHEPFETVSGGMDITMLGNIFHSVFQSL